MIKSPDNYAPMVVANTHSLEEEVKFLSARLAESQHTVAMQFSNLRAAEDMLENARAVLASNKNYYVELQEAQRIRGLRDKQIADLSKKLATVTRERDNAERLLEDIAVRIDKLYYKLPRWWRGVGKWLTR